MSKRRPLKPSRRVARGLADAVRSAIVAEALEGRLLFQAAPTLTWTGGVSGDWFNGQNWDQGYVPTNLDNVVINNGGPNIPSNAQFADLTLNGGYISGTVNVNGAFTWNGGNIIGADVVVAAGGVFNVDIPNDSAGTFSGELDNSGTVNWNGGGIAGAGLTITNEDGGVFESQSPGPLTGATLNNLGDFIQPAGASELSDVTFDNAGEIDVLCQTLSIDAGSTFTDDGIIDVVSAAQLNLAGNSAFGADATFTGPGPLMLAGSVNGVLSGPNFQVPYGLEQSTFTLSGVMTWTAADMPGVDLTVAPGGVFNIGLPGWAFPNWTGELDNDGAVNWNGGGLNAPGLTINNQGLFVAQSDSTLSDLTFNNSGDFIQPGGGNELSDVTFSNTGDIQVQAGILSIDSGSTFTDDGLLDVAAGAQLDLAGQSTFGPDATYTQAGPIALAGSVNGILNGPNFQVPGGLEQSTFTLAGTLAWTGGDMTSVYMTVASGGVFNIDLPIYGAANWTGTLDNFAAVNWTSGALAAPGLTITNEAEGVFTAESNSTLGGAAIDNFGQFVQPGGTNELSDITFQNMGDVEIQCGSLSIDNGSAVTDDSTIDVAAGAELVLSGNSTFGDDETFTGPGAVLLEGSVNGTLNGPNFQVAYGLDQSIFALLGAMTWTGGDMLAVNATVEPGGVFNINLPYWDFADWNGELVNDAAVNWNGGGLNAPYLTINNQSLFTAQSGSTLGDLTFNNSGEFIQTGGDNELSDVNFDNSGDVQVQAGTFSIDNGSTITDDATIVVATGAELVLSGNSTFGVNETFTGPGPVLLEGSINGTLNGPNFQVAYGLDQSAFTLSGTMTWTGGDMLAVIATVTPGGTLDIDLPYWSFPNWTGELDNDGAVNWNGGGLNAPDLTINNQGLFTAQSGSTLADLTFNNVGDFLQLSGANELSDVNFDNTGDIEIQAGTLSIDNGSTITDGATIDVAAGAELILSGNSIFGVNETFTGPGPVILQGTVNGTLNGPNFQVSSGLNQGIFTLSGTMAWTGGDMLTVNATVTCGGVFNIDLPYWYYANWTGELDNHGAVNWNSGGLNAPDLTIKNHCLFVAQSGSTLGDLTFDNHGQFVQLAGADELSDVIFVNTCDVEVQAGTLSIDNGSIVTDNGTINVAAGAELVLSGNNTFGVNETFTGPGPVLLEGTVNGTLNGPNFQVPQGLYQGVFNLSGMMTWTGGDMLTVNATVTCGSVFNINLPYWYYANWTGELDNYGTVNWNCGGLNAPDMTINNQCLFVAQSSSTLGDLTFNNNGQFVQPAGANEFSDVDFNNNGQVLVDGGGLTYSQGLLTFGDGSTISGQIIADSVVLDGCLNCQDAQLQTALITGNATITGSLAWTGGTWTGDPTVACGASLKLLGPAVINGVPTIQNGGTLDVTDTSLTINYGSPSADPIAAIAAAIQHGAAFRASGYNYCSWNGTGITSSTAKALANSNMYAIGYLDGNNSFDNQYGTVAPDQILVEFTVNGNAFLESTIGFRDLSMVAAHYGASAGMDWAESSFDYTGSVGFGDLSAVAAHYGCSTPQCDGSANDSAILSLAWQSASAVVTQSPTVVAPSANPAPTAAAPLAATAPSSSSSSSPVIVAASAGTSTNNLNNVQPDDTAGDPGVTQQLLTSTASVLSDSSAS